MPANSERGEFAITFNGVTYGLRPSFEAIQEIEAKTGRSLRAIATAINSIDLPVEELGVVVATMMRAWGSSDPKAENAEVAIAVRDKRIATLIYDKGIVPVSMDLTPLLVAAISGGVTAAGEPKASVAKGTITDA